MFASHLRRLLLWIVIIVFVASVPCYASPGSAQEPAAIGGTSSLAQHAMIHHFRQSRDPGLLAEQLLAADLYRRRVHTETIVSTVASKRREWARLRRSAVTGQWTAEEYLKTTTRLLGRAATQIAGAGGTGVEVANLAIFKVSPRVYTWGSNGSASTGRRSGSSRRTPGTSPVQPPPA